MTKKKENCPICGRKRNAEGSCDNEFCKKHNYQHFRTLIKYFGFDKAKLGTVEVESEFNRVRNYLYDLYWNKNLDRDKNVKEIKDEDIEIIPEDAVMNKATGGDDE